MLKKASWSGCAPQRRRPAYMQLHAAAAGLAFCVVGLLVTESGAQGQSLPVHFWAAGHVIPLETSAVWRRGETYVPLEALPAIGARGTLSSRRGDVTVRLSSGRIDSLPLYPINRRPMLRLSDLAVTANGLVVGPNSLPSRGLRPDTTYLFARIIGVRLGPTALRISTSFPVPFVSRSIGGRSARGYVDCIGATGDGFRPFLLPADERRAERIRIAQFVPYVARVAVDFTPGFSLEPISTHNKVTARFTAPLIDGRYAGGRGSDPDNGWPTDRPKPPGEDPNGGSDQPPVKPRPRPRTAEIRSIKAEPLDSQSIQIVIETDRQARAYVRYSTGSRQVVIDIPNSHLNLDDERQKDREIQHPLVEWLSAASIESSPRVPPLTRITVDATRTVTTSVESDSNQIIIEIAVPESGRINPVKPGAAASQAVVVVDAGHGGAFTGAKTRVRERDVYEKDITLAIAVRLRAALEARGSRVVMTRADDTNVPLEDRPRIANEVGANVFISIHNDSSGKPNTFTGTTTYYHGASPESRRLAQCVEKELASVSGMRDRGAMSDTAMYPIGFCVLRDTSMPAVLCEVGYLNNAADRSKLMDKAFQRRVAEAVCNGIRHYVSGGQSASRHRAKKLEPTA